MEGSPLTIFDYEAVHQPWFEKFNRNWIEQYFGMEAIDERVLRFPGEYIVAAGGRILMARYGNEIAGTVALKFVSPGVYEFTKMAVDEKFRGRQIGKSLALSAIALARQLNAHKIILYSHTSLQPAISLYRNLGFEEVPLDGPYKRSDIKMALRLETSEKFSLRMATVEDAAVLTALGKKTFYDSFAEMNTKEDMNIYLAKNFHVEQLESELSDGENSFLIVESCGKVVGFAKMRKSEPPNELRGENCIEIERIYAVKDLIGKGVGTILMQRCLRKATEEGFESVWLGVWEHNLRAISFYDKWGFVKFGSHPFMLGNDLQTDLLFKKEIKLTI
ncbi:MAG: GNAT family N-acetyltransferase [Chryseolinea sp.]